MALNHEKTEHYRSTLPFQMKTISSLELDRKMRPWPAYLQEVSCKTWEGKRIVTLKWKVINLNGSRIQEDEYELVN